MNFLNKLEHKLGRYAIRGLFTYIIGLNGLVFVLNVMDQSGTLISRLTLDPAMIVQGEWWRLFTFVFIPPSFSPLWLFVTLYIYYMIGAALESEWGSFRFNLYYLLGVCGTAIASFLTGTQGTPTYLNLSLFLAFARLFPEYEFVLFFILPVKVKYLAWLNWAYIGYTILIQADFSSKVAAIVALINYFIFFGKEIGANAARRHQVHQNRQRFRDQFPEKTTMHKCEICGKTEKDDPKLEFRYCAQCDGDHEYCMEHLHSHEHVKNCK